MEEFLGIQRTDHISGRQLIRVYQDYIKTKEPELKSAILQHNKEDILSLSRIQSLLIFEPLASGHFSVEEYSLSEHAFSVRLSLPFTTPCLLYTSSVNYDTSTACCLCHRGLQSSCLNAILGLSRNYYNVNGYAFQHWILLSHSLPEISVKDIFCNRSCHAASGSAAFHDHAYDDLSAVMLRTADKPCVGILIIVILGRAGFSINFIS